MSGAKIIIQGKTPTGEYIDILVDAAGLMKSLSLISDGVDTATITDVAGKKSLDVNVTNISVSASDDSIEVRNLPMSQLIDEASADVLYVGEALVGTVTSSPAWRIKKIQTIGNLTQTKWAAGSIVFDQVWDNRASLTYL